jgi:hypothetical protein
MNILGCSSYKKFCDVLWSRGDKLPESGIIFVDLDSIPEFFNLIKEDGNKKKYIVVSAGSDWCLHYQQDRPVYTNIERAVGLFLRPEIGYSGVNIEARCDLTRCNITDKYAISCYAWTSATFPEIPSSVVKWYVTNNMIQDDRIVTLPFGINDVSQDINCREIINNTHKHKLGNRQIQLYVNFQFCTKERLELYQYFDRLSKLPEFSRIVVENNIPFDQYCKRLADSQYVLCPAGNGLTCFRELETIALGAIPVVADNIDYGGIPHVQLPSLYLSHMLPNIDRSSEVIIPSDECYEEYWQNRIESSRELISGV